MNNCCYYGKYLHYCYDWDEMLICECCPEIESCLCFSDTICWLETYEFK